jgi:hypothetical protein
VAINPVKFRRLKPVERCSLLMMKMEPLTLYSRPV